MKTGKVSILCALLVLASAFVSEAATITVPTDFSSIQDAVYAARTGDTVFFNEFSHILTSLTEKRPQLQSPTISFLYYHYKSSGNICH